MENDTKPEQEYTPKDGDRYIENPGFVWVAALGKWIYQPEEEEKK